MRKYWVKIGEKIGGPFSSEKLQQLATIGKLKPTHLVSSDKKRWAIAEKIPEVSFPLEPAEHSLEGVSKRDLKSDGSRTSNQSEPSSKSPLSLLTQSYLPVGDNKPPTVTVGKDSYLQVVTIQGEVIKTTLASTRKKLLSGELTRHHVTRWIEPRPKKSDYKDESDPDDETMKEAYLSAVKEWKVRRMWRPIGEGLMKDSYRIGLLYRPAKVFMELGTYITGGILFVAVLILFGIMMFQQLMASEIHDSEGFKQVAKSISSENVINNPIGYFSTREMMRLSLPILIPVALTVGGAILSVAGLIGLAGGFLFGGLGGWLLGTCISPLLPTPPPDGYVEQTEQIT